MKMYHTATQKAYDELMLDLEEKGYKWLSGHKPTHFRYWEQEKENSCIKISGKRITFDSIEWHKKEYPDTPVIEYKEKGDNQMANKECNQCHKKWHQDSAKYCSWCGNKLVDEPEFKVGDIVASQVLSDGAFSFVRLNEDLTNRLACVYGFWYFKRDCEVKGVSLRVFKEDTRHATPEEILEYESALNFHKHGREPFEVKEGDLIENKSGRNTIVFYPENYSRVSFLKDGWEFLKTAEEVSEWLKGENE